MRGVYAIRHVASGRLYIGSSERCERRLREHRNKLRGGRHPNPRLQRAWKRDGEAAFVDSILEIVPTSVDLLVVEQRWIDATPKRYNVIPAGAVPSFAGRQHSEAEKERWRKQWQDPAYRAKMIAAIRASWADPERRAARLAGMQSERANAARRVNAAKGRDAMSRESYSRAGRKRWADPEYRARQSAVNRAQWATGGSLDRVADRVRATLAEHSRRRAADPAARARHGAIMRKHWQDPAYRAKKGLS